MSNIHAWQRALRQAVESRRSLVPDELRFIVRGHLQIIAFEQGEVERAASGSSATHLRGAPAVRCSRSEDGGQGRAFFARSSERSADP